MDSKTLIELDNGMTKADMTQEQKLSPLGRVTRIVLHLEEDQAKLTNEWDTFNGGSHCLWESLGS